MLKHALCPMCPNIAICGRGLPPPPEDTEAQAEKHHPEALSLSLLLDGLSHLDGSTLCRWLHHAQLSTLSYLSRDHGALGELEEGWGC